MDAVQTSIDYLRAVRRGGSGHEAAATLSEYDRDALARDLDGDDARRAFWCNLYNAAAQTTLQACPEAFEDRRSFFAAPLVAVAGRDLSLDDVEHGLLRRSHPKWGLGYVPDPFPSAFEREFRAESVDPRVHFALNCGAAACPPIAAYERDRVDEQLDLAAESYLGSECEHDPDAGVVRVPRLLLWYRGDFGGRAGIREMLAEYGVLPEGATPRIRYRAYDWSLALGAFTER